MEFRYENLSDPRIFGEGCVAPHSDHGFYRSEQEIGGESSFRFNLNGLWQFHYGENYTSAIPGFQSLQYDCSGWDRIRVPSHIQLEGYDIPQYVNTQYPWEGHEELRPGQVPEQFNPVASYVKYFTLPESMAGQRVFLVLEGAESGAAVWLNGTYIGYHEDSFTPAEFELTCKICPGENKLAVQVFKWCLGSWFEDQDFFRFSGLYRDVYLYAIPQTHIWDLEIRATPGEDLQTGEFSLRAELMGTGTVSLTLKQGDRAVYTARQSGSGILNFRGEIPHPHLWSGEDPYLYHCIITVSDAQGNFCELLSEKVGFRRFGIKDGLMCLNGKRIVFNGVNRHAFHSRRGRSLGKEDILRDLTIIKQNNINAIRTCHYPNSAWFYSLCDALGIYVMDEVNLETHGTWDLMGSPEDQACVLPGDRTEYQEMLVHRARALYERDKNHPSVLIWSCGNESGGGSVIWEMSRFLRSRDNTRLVHYEGIFHDRRYPDTSDMESQMYIPAADIEKFLNEHRDKPFLLCEYSHAMGNSCGGLHKYTDLALREKRYQGGFIWDFADQALYRKNRFGEEYLAYGGDFGDRPTDYSFSGNGLVSGDRVISPKMQEVRYLYQSLGIRVLEKTVEITNRNLFVSSSRWNCRVRVERCGVCIEEKSLKTDVKPLSAGEYPLELTAQREPGLYTVTVSFHLRQDTLWAAAGHEVAFGQRAYEIPAERHPETKPFRVIHSKHNIGVQGENFEVLFSLLQGGLTSYRWKGREMLDGIPMPNFWRAPTDNDKGNLMAARYGQWKLASLYLGRSRAADPWPERLPWKLTEEKDSAVLSFRYWLPTSPEAYCDVSYRVFGSGRVEVTMAYEPVAGLPPMPEFSFLVPMQAEKDRVQWYGLGPADTYWDRQRGGRMGLYENRAADNLAPYLVPQECGNKEKVRFASVTDGTGRGLGFLTEDPHGFCFSALPYTPHQLELADHAYELPRPVHTFVRVGLAQMGVGGDDSWGARTHREYLLANDRPLRFTFSFCGIG